MNLPNPFGYDIDATLNIARLDIMNFTIATFDPHHESQNSRINETILLKKLVEHFV